MQAGFAERPEASLAVSAPVLDDDLLQGLERTALGGRVAEATAGNTGAFALFGRTRRDDRETSPGDKPGIGVEENATARVAVRAATLAERAGHPHGGTVFEAPFSGLSRPPGHPGPAQQSELCCWLRFRAIVHQGSSQQMGVGRRFGP